MVSDIGTNALELAAANVFQVLALRRGGGGLSLKINRNLKAFQNLGRDVTRHRDAILIGHSIDRDERALGPLPFADGLLNTRPVIQFRSLPYSTNRGFLNGFALSGNGDDASVVVGVHLPSRR